MNVDPATVASVIVAIIAAAAAVASQRAASRASVVNTNTTAQAQQASDQAQALKDSYERARKFDVETIERQDSEIAELRAKVTRLEIENRQLNLRVWYLEGGHPVLNIKEEDDVIDVEGEEETNGT